MSQNPLRMTMAMLLLRMSALVVVSASIRGMPRKIGFMVVTASSHEDNFSAKELMVHAPTVNGWRSSRLCCYPQHITLQLVERCRVRKLQLLAHQYLIPAKVEFHIGDALPETSTSGCPGQLRRLGGFLAMPDLNCDATEPSREQLIEHYLNSTQLDAPLDTTFMGKCESTSPLDDLAFDMYQDPEVAHIIRLLDHKKLDMVQQEKYERAKNLKQAIADLQKKRVPSVVQTVTENKDNMRNLKMVGERLARYDVEKRCAIEKEDYDLAKKKKELMEEYRRSVYQQLEVHNLLDMAMITRAADSSSTQEPPAPPPSPGRRSVPTKTPASTAAGGETGAPPNQRADAEAVAAEPSGQPDAPCGRAAGPRIDGQNHISWGQFPPLPRGVSAAAP
ncbi:Centrosomal protein [Liparis tanakae]|uniref:Centrosomal protein n=1 Tax=Liparis tanakae TaxID=230148 RepID=A0A4Z2F4D7_9TELE|nr:Centrosomal protein [Liparis tanakae]